MNKWYELGEDYKDSAGIKYVIKSIRNRQAAEDRQLKFLRRLLEVSDNVHMHNEEFSKILGGTWGGKKTSIYNSMLSRIDDLAFSGDSTYKRFISLCHSACWDKVAECNDFDDYRIQLIEAVTSKDEELSACAQVLWASMYGFNQFIRILRPDNWYDSNISVMEAKVTRKHDCSARWSAIRSILGMYDNSETRRLLSLMKLFNDPSNCVECVSKKLGFKWDGTSHKAVKAVVDNIGIPAYNWPQITVNTVFGEVDTEGLNPYKAVDAYGHRIALINNHVKIGNYASEFNFGNQEYMFIQAFLLYAGKCGLDISYMHYMTTLILKYKNADKDDLYYMAELVYALLYDASDIGLIISGKPPKTVYPETTSNYDVCVKSILGLDVNEIKERMYRVTMTERMKESNEDISKTIYKFPDVLMKIVTSEYAWYLARYLTYYSKE